MSPRHQPPNPATDRLLTVHEAAELLGLRPGTLYNWAHQSRLPTVRVGRALRLSDLQRLTARVRSGPAPRRTRCKSEEK